VGFLRRLVPAPIAGLARRLWDAPGTESARTLLEALAKEARRDRITGLGAEVAFFVILSVFSALLVMALALGFLGSILGQAVAQQAQDRVIATLVLSVGTILTCAVMLATLVVGPLLGAGGSVAGAVGLGGVFATAWVWVRVPLLLVVLLLWAATVLHVARTTRPPGVPTPSALRSPPRGESSRHWDCTSGWRWRRATQVLGALGGSLILLVWIYLLALGAPDGRRTNRRAQRAPFPD